MIYVNWGGQKVKLTWLPGYYPEQKLITSVHGYCFEKDKTLLVHIKERGFNIPGGHIEAGESPEDAFHREAFEEGYVKGNLQFLGSIEINHEENSLFDPNGKYPLIGYQLFYRMDINERHPFKRKNESTSRIWVEPIEIPYIINDHEIALIILEEAIGMTPLQQD